MFYLLLGGYNYMRANHRYLSYDTGTSIENTHQQKFTNRYLNHLSVKETKLDKTIQYLLADDVEDEETNSSAARKYRLLACFYLSLTSLFVLGNRPTLFKHHGPTPGLLSNKYIAQRVLRI
ncbi:hypothetical protein [uncultured Chitinophaga sp.]|uniref:hypothetical protein n=1 Tax=uncultured Chitinophaga sp. TaxID=339340 RepID=UPI0025EA9B3B|nr:hypothetical protein [uncultured Chitinophaga sp.]